MATTTPLPSSSFHRISQRFKGTKSAFLVTERLTPIDIFVEVKGPSVSGGTDTAYDATQVEAFLCSQGVPPRKYEWDDYAEPLWDPLKSEVQLLVTEYFERADADTH